MNSEQQMFRSLGNEDRKLAQESEKSVWRGRRGTRRVVAWRLSKEVTPKRRVICTKF